MRVEGEVNGENEGGSNRENGGGVEGRKGGVADVYCDFVVKVGLTWWSGEASKQLQELVEKRGGCVKGFEWVGERARGGWVEGFEEGGGG